MAGNLRTKILKNCPNEFGSELIERIDKLEYDLKQVLVEIETTDPRDLIDLDEALSDLKEIIRGL